MGCSKEKQDYGIELDPISNLFTFTFSRFADAFIHTDLQLGNTKRINLEEANTKVFLVRLRYFRLKIPAEGWNILN